MYNLDTMTRLLTEKEIENILDFLEISTYIPKEQKHRLMNDTDSDLIIIEVQCGEYVGEDDILRFDDFYGRETDG